MYAAGAAVTRSPTRLEPVLQRAEVEPAGPPDHEFPVEDHVVELGHRGGDLGEARGEVAELPGRRCTPCRSRKASALNPSYFGSNDHPGLTGSCATVLAAIGCRGERSGALTAGL
jgi:hypothetical protein